jgi:hypothetical protein
LIGVAVINPIRSPSLTGFLRGLCGEIYGVEHKEKKPNDSAGGCFTAPTNRDGVAKTGRTLTTQAGAL